MHKKFCLDGKASQNKGPYITSPVYVEN